MKKTIDIKYRISLPIIMALILISIYGCTSHDKKDGFHFDNINTVVVPKSNYVILGDKYMAKVVLSAYSSTTPMEMKVDSNPNQSFSYNEGTFLYEVIPTEEGEHKFRGEIKIPGSGKTYPFETSYIVAKPTAIIVPSEFVLYRNKENKLDISAPGFSSDKLSVLATNCKIDGKNGKYIIVPGKENKVTITVLSYLNGEGQKIGAYDYPVVDK
jgi:gliding motility-associated protein GldM